jgi:hypothetical protein
MFHLGYAWRRGGRSSHALALWGGKGAGRRGGNELDDRIVGVARTAPVRGSRSAAVAATGRCHRRHGRGRLPGGWFRNESRRGNGRLGGGGGGRGSGGGDGGVQELGRQISAEVRLLALVDADASRACLLTAHGLLLLAVRSPGLFVEAVVEVVAQVRAGLAPRLLLQLRDVQLQHRLAAARRLRQVRQEPAAPCASPRHGPTAPGRTASTRAAWQRVTNTPAQLGTAQLRPDTPRAAIYTAPRGTVGRFRLSSTAFWFSTSSKSCTSVTRPQAA